MEFVPRCSLNCERPLHLAPYVDTLENAIGTDGRIVLAAPPQHGKTTVTIAALVWWLKKYPHLSFVYATYSQDRAYQVSKLAQYVAFAAGLQLSGQTLGLWTTPQGGQILWTSVGGALTGNPASGVVVVDDPISGPQDANSPTVRQGISDWFDQNCFSRRHPGTSFIVMATRWHQDDLSGRLVKGGQFRYINLKAIADERRPEGDNRRPGEALWPEKRPIKFLLESQRLNIWAFNAMYQGSPVPKGGALFHPATYYTELPTKGFRVVYGVDLSYTEKSHADWSVCVELWVVPPPRGLAKKPEDPNLLEPSGFTFYVVDVQRKQVEAPAFTLTLKAKHTTRPSKFWWYASGTEKGGGSFIKTKVPLVLMDTNGRDKYARAQQTSAEWNSGAVLVPENAESNPWQSVFVDEVTSFTGVKDLCDDQVDALVAAVDAAIRGAGADEIPDRSGGRYS